MSHRPRIVVFSSLFPNSAQPNAGLFIRERMFRVRDAFHLTVVSPVPWFPCQSLLRLLRPGFRPAVPAFEQVDGVNIFHPRFLSVPGMAKWLDGFSMAICTLPLIRRLRSNFDVVLIDSHFAYPDGYAASCIGKWLSIPVTVTLRGTELRLSAVARIRGQIKKALQRATRVIAVSSSLKQVAVSLGIEDTKIRVIGNGIDLQKFKREPGDGCRERLGIPLDARVLISVGGLTERKGFHRVIALLPDLVKQFPNLIYLIVGGGSAEGDWGPRLKAQVAHLDMDRHVRFLGAVPPTELKFMLSAANVFVLATSNEGWANVFLEAMACGLPIVTTNVGGNAEVVSCDKLGTIVPFGREDVLAGAIDSALRVDWDRDAIIRYARDNSWDTRMVLLKEELGAAIGMQTDRSAGAYGAAGGSAFDASSANQQGR